MTQRPLVLRVLSSLLHHLLVPWCISAVFLVVAVTASSLIGMVLATVLAPLLMSVGKGVYGMGGGLLAVSSGWIALWLLFLLAAKNRRGSAPAANDAMESANSDREEFGVHS
ncbi:MAG: hypothetical protein KA144_02625 [Xanthomonadaceae bacterium]|nr:hypothetical protein [Xanthomonadaceae bacterium]